MFSQAVLIARKLFFTNFFLKELKLSYTSGFSLLAIEREFAIVNNTRNLFRTNESYERTEI